MNEKPVIIVTGKVPNMQSWYEEKCKRALEELAHLSDTILTNVSCGQRKSVSSEDVGYIVDEGFAGYEKVWEKFVE